MKNSIRHLLAALGMMCLVASGSAQAQITIDGSADIGYGSALSTQNTNTQFGDADSGDSLNPGGGSEIDQVFATVENGRLYVMITGNLEANFNKLDVFIDVDENVGMNTIDGSLLPTDVDKFCCDGQTSSTNAFQRMEGMRFDVGFTADHYLSFSNGFEKVRPDTPEQLEFYALTAHYSAMNEGVNGTRGALGMQLAPRGLPNVLRGTTGDFDVDGNVDGGEFLTFQQNAGGSGLTRNQGDATGEGDVDGADLGVFQSVYGFEASNSPLDQNYFAPLNSTVDNSDALVGPALPNLSQGELIDQDYALSSTGGQGTDNEGTGLIAGELEFTLPPAASDPTNAFSHRDMMNIIDLELAIDNSNTAGVSGDDGPNDDYSTVTEGDPENVMTGIEFSIPLSAIGNPTGDIRIAAMVNGSNHDYLSNQIAGVGVLQGNPGGDGAGGYIGDLAGIDFQAITGDQFVTVTQGVPATGAVPEPTSIVLMFAGMGCSLLRRRS